MDVDVDPRELSDSFATRSKNGRTSTPAPSTTLMPDSTVSVPSAFFTLRDRLPVMMSASFGAAMR